MSFHPFLETRREHGDICEVLGEDEGAYGSAHAEDQGDVGENEEILQRGWGWLLCGIGRRFEED